MATELYGPLMLTLSLVAVLLYGMKTSGHEVVSWIKPLSLSLSLSVSLSLLIVTLLVFTSYQFEVRSKQLCSIYCICVKFVHARMYK